MLEEHQQWLLDVATAGGYAAEPAAPSTGAMLLSGNFVTLFARWCGSFWEFTPAIYRTEYEDPFAFINRMSYPQRTWDYDKAFPKGCPSLNLRTANTPAKAARLLETRLLPEARRWRDFGALQAEQERLQFEAQYAAIESATAGTRFKLRDRAEEYSKTFDFQNNNSSNIAARLSTCGHAQSWRAELSFLTPEQAHKLALFIETL